MVGLAAELLSGDEVYANLEYGFSLVALSFAAGCVSQLVFLVYRHSGNLASACCMPTGVLPAAMAPGSRISGGEGWPVLIALLFGPLCVLLAGLGGWV